MLGLQKGRVQYWQVSRGGREQRRMRPPSTQRLGGHELTVAGCATGGHQEALSPVYAPNGLGYRSPRQSVEADMSDETQESLITDEMRAAVGKESDPTTLEIDKTSVRMFARAVGYTDPVYYDEEAAKAAGYRSLPAPPGYLGTPDLRSEQAHRAPATHRSPWSPAGRIEAHAERRHGRRVPWPTSARAMS